MTVRDLITAAMQEIGAIATGEPLSSADAQAAFIRFNSLLSLWQTERLTIFNLATSTFTFTVNQQSYTIGTVADGANFQVAVRPHYLEKAAIRWTDDTGQPVEIPIPVITDDEWAAIRIKDVTSTIPTKVYYNPTWPLGTLYYWPIPTTTDSAPVLYIPTPMTVAASLDTVLNLAPGYEEAIRYNLAVRLAPIFGRTLDPVVAGMSNESKAQIKRANTRPDPMMVDEAITGPRAAFSVFTGGF